MERVAFTMKLKPGCEEEYIKRHDAIWPELQLLLKTKGISNYSIFLDTASLVLFGVLTIGDRKKLDELPGERIMQRWWAYMKDIMETNIDHSPKTNSLKEVFFLP